MAQIKKISSTLSVAATLLLEACSSSSSDSGPSPVANTTAPQLLTTWTTGCIMTQNSSPTTVTQASGGGGGGGSVSGGAGYITNAVFHQDGRVEFSTENYATENCNANTLSSLNRYNALYYVGDTLGSEIFEIDYSAYGSTTYSIFQVINNTLYLGDETTSSPGYDGSSEATRYDGLGTDMLNKIN